MILEVHKAKLYVCSLHSFTYALANPRKLLDEIDTYAKTFQRVVDWNESSQRDLKIDSVSFFARQGRESGGRLGLLYVWG
jgi:hypothetical protein